MEGFSKSYFTFEKSWNERLKIRKRKISVENLRV